MIEIVVVMTEIEIVLFWLHSNSNPNSQKLSDAMMSFPGIDNSCLNEPDNPYVIMPPVAADFSLKMTNFISRFSLCVPSSSARTAFSNSHSLSFFSCLLFPPCFILPAWLPSIPAALCLFLSALSSCLPSWFSCCSVQRMWLKACSRSLPCESVICIP